MGNSESFLFFWKNWDLCREGRSPYTWKKKRKGKCHQKEVLQIVFLLFCFCFCHWAKWECTQISKEHYHLMCFLVYKMSSANIILTWVLIMAGDLRYKDMWWQQWERLWRPRVHHHHSSPGCWFHEMGGTSKAQICDLIKKKRQVVMQGAPCARRQVLKNWITLLPELIVPPQLNQYHWNMGQPVVVVVVMCGSGGSIARLNGTNKPILICKKGGTQGVGWSCANTVL